MFTTDELAYALFTLATAPELPTSEHETEQLAVAFIRRMKENADILSEYDRAIRIMGKRMFGIGGSASARERLASARLDGELDRSIRYCVPGYVWTHRKAVRVNGKELLLKWVS